MPTTEKQPGEGVPHCPRGVAQRRDGSGGMINRASAPAALDPSSGMQSCHRNSSKPVNTAFGPLYRWAPLSAPRSQLCRAPTLTRLRSWVCRCGQDIPWARRQRGVAPL